jgi:hypothetical protein
MGDNKPRATLPTSTVKHNIELNAQALKNEPPDRNAAWWQRKFWATLYSTWKGLVERH